ncbi:YcaO-like family protein [Rhodococcus fascians]|nr:YcaO-like family protein [Rhodococcus fascians]MBY4139446.1 YcaO-like family protein [Rhodococcus fascians]MBY4217913.1 YcaO-like family protein [Rhodococcus fascians]MBY4224021.1 YcaO-like family protein [Rhodococcus fascians]MBY4233499.1 YcaO-like family protein [Rhodococcus fascians]
MSVHASSLHGSRLGVLTGVGPLERDVELPSAWVGYRAHVACMDRVVDWVADPIGFGASFGDHGAARGAAIGEAVERYCGNAVPPHLDRASYRELRARGIDALDPGTFALYSPEQYASRGFPFVPFTADTPVEWVEGVDMHDGRAVRAPAGSVYLNYIRGSRTSEPPLHSLMYSGIATGTSRQRAEQSAIEELLERDATTIWWASGTDAHRLDDGGRVIGQMGCPAEGFDLDVTLINIPSQFGVPVVGALVRDRARELVAFGSACRATPHAAATKALVEALGSMQLSRQLADPDSETWQSVRTGAMPDHVFLPYRADRNYLDAAGKNFRNLVDLPAVAQLYQDRRMQAGAALLRLEPRDLVAMDEIPAVTGSVRETYLAALARHGIDAVVVDLTTDDIAQSGLTVVRVLTPQLVGNGPPAFPLHGSPRLLEVPTALGWNAHPRNSSDLVRVPLPLA